MIVIDCTMEELRELLDGKSIPLDPQGPLVPFAPHDGELQPPSSEDERPPLTRLEKLKQAIGKSDEEILVDYCVENLQCHACPIYAEDAAYCKTHVNGCSYSLAEWLREDPALKGETE